jgi:hypothetical protein
MPVEAFAFVGFDTDRVVRFALNLLAVGGGFLVGHVLTGVIAWALDRWVTGGKTPHGVHRVARIIGGVALALLVALMLFGQGGYGDGTGPGGGPNPDDKGPGGGTATQPTTNKDVQPPPPIPRQDATPPEQRVRVTLLGGSDVKDEKFYLIDDDRTPRTFADVVAAVNAKKAETKKPVGVEVRFTADNTLAENHPAVLRVILWARANDVAVTLPAAKP